MQTIRLCSTAAALALLSSMAPPGAQAAPFLLTLAGALFQTSLSGTPIADDTPFTVNAQFDTASPNLVPFIPGTTIYIPSAASISFSGTTYQIAPYAAATPFGVAVTIFDPTSPFPPSPEYGIGLVGNPLLDGAGIVADFVASTPDFTVDNLVTTTFPASTFVGTGIFSGVCTDDPSICNDPNVLHDNDVEPFPLTAGGHSYSLQFGNNVILDYVLALDDPSSGSSLPFSTTIDDPFTASLTAVPEPDSYLVLGMGLIALWARGRTRRG